jgi:hypothetical protein
MKTINLCSNLQNGAGLQRDTELLRRMLESYGHQVQTVMWNARHTLPDAHLNIFLEVTNLALVPKAPQNWLIPNSEWYYPQLQDCVLPQMNKILCKTRDACDIWEKKVGPSRVVYIGFESNDLYRPAIKREKIFLHIAGKSETKNSQAVIQAWKQFNIAHPLIFVAYRHDIGQLCQGVRNVRYINHLSDDAVIEYLNTCQFHIMPSKYEGFGHIIHEGLGCGAVVITTNAPPMKDFVGIPQELLVPVERRELLRIAMASLVNPAQIAQRVNDAAALLDERIAEISANARRGFLEEREKFRQLFAGVINSL